MDKGTGMEQPTPRWQVLPDANAVAVHAADLIIDSACRAISERRHFRIVLAGGRTPEQTYLLLRSATTDWSRWEVFYGDERCLPAGHPDRNSTMAEQALLSRVPIASVRIHPIPAELGPAAAAARYSAVIRVRMPFDVVLLGMGEDGHTASLFPGRAHGRDELVHAVFDAPKPPPERVSLSCSSLTNAGRLIVMVTGGGKRDALARWRAGEPLPVARVVAASAAAEVLVDEAAWGV